MRIINGIPVFGTEVDQGAETVRILHTLKPIGVAMAGANEFDPYKD